MIKTDVVLFNSCGCEIARETIENGQDYNQIVSDWVIYPDDRIELQDTWHEE